MTETRGHATGHTRGARRYAAAAIAVLLLLAAAYVLVWRGQRPPRVVVLGVDGLHLPLLSELVAKNVTPNFARLYREGSVGSVLTYEVSVPALSPIIWTSFATGEPPAVHGVWGFVPAGPSAVRPRLVSSHDRRAPAVWEIVSDAGKRVGVVNWLVTYPAERVNGFVITERYIPVSAQFLAKSVGADLDRDASRLVHPPELAATLAKLPIQPRAAMPLNPEQGEEVDREIFRLAYAALEEHPVDLLMIYTRSVDELSHLFWHTHEPLPGEPPVHDFIVELMKRYDGLLGELMDHLGPKDHLVVLSDHGMERNRGAGLSGQHASREVAVGVFLLWGAGIRAGVQLPPASPFDVLPTILELLGIPPAENMRGKVLLAAFEAGHTPLPRRPTAYVRHGGGTDDAASPADDAIVERLKALGYVQ